MNRSRALIAIQNAFEYGIVLAHVTHPDDKAYYEKKMKRCLKAAAEHAGFRVFEADEIEQERSA